MRYPSVMMPSSQGSFRLFRFSGIDVFVHWSWFLVAVYEISHRTGQYSSPIWNVAEYLALFAIVLLHEFGHSLACRQVGGHADRIVLWPLGGVAVVAPPQRPGAMLWSIAAGPLVNIALVPVFMAAQFAVTYAGLMDAAPDARQLLHSVTVINIVLLVFNLVPVYPLDGGQILRSLLWFVMGRARSLLVASILGFAGVGLLVLAAISMKSVWFGILALFILMNCWQGLLQALALARRDKLPRHPGFACPACGAAPLIGPRWRCGQCGTAFDTFATGAVCPTCATRFTTTQCMDCGEQNPPDWWSGRRA